MVVVGEEVREERMAWFLGFECSAVDEQRFVLHDERRKAR